MRSTPRGCRRRYAVDERAAKTADRGKLADADRRRTSG
jgi:hypothetical protein